MVDYRNRPAEVKGIIVAEDWSSPLAGEPSDTQISAEQAAAERALFLEKTAEYFQVRDGRLDQLARALDDILSGDSNPESRWQGPLVDLTSDGDRLLDALLGSSRAPTKRALALQFKFASQEAHFVDTLFAKRIATRWSALSEIHMSLLVMMVGLRAKWETLASKTEEIDRQAEQTAEGVARLLKLTFENSRRAASSVGRLFNSATDDLVRMRDLPGRDSSGKWIEQVLRDVETPIGSIREAVFKQMEVDAAGWDQTAGALRGYVSSLKALQDAEVDGIHRTFKEVQKSTEAFAREPSHRRAQAIVEECGKLLSDWNASMLTGGLKADARAVGDGLIEQAKKKVSMIETLFKEFEDQNKGRFYDSLEAKTTEVLLQESKWKTRKSAIESLAPRNEIAQFCQNVERLYGLDIKQPWWSMIDAVASGKVPADKVEARDKLVSTLKERWVDVWAQIEAHRNGLAAMMKKAQGMVEGSEFDGLYTRSRVESSLRS